MTRRGAAAESGSRHGGPAPAAAELGVEPHSPVAAAELQSLPLARTPSNGPPDPLRALAADVPGQGLGPRTEAAARMQLASAEAVSPGDELEVLAGKVKRILDAEARRHGIDV
jgi:hypothetical protein